MLECLLRAARGRVPSVVMREIQIRYKRSTRRGAVPANRVGDITILDEFTPEDIAIAINQEAIFRTRNSKYTNIYSIW